MQKYRLSLTCILPYIDRIVDSVLIRENASQWKPVLSHILYSGELIASVNITSSLQKVPNVELKIRY